MTTLQKFKLVATQCSVVAGSTSRNPSPEPAFHVGRRRTLLHLLTRTASRRRGVSHPGLLPPRPHRRRRRRRLDSLSGLTLKNLFISSPPPPMPPLARSDGSGVLRFLPPPPRCRGGAGQSAGGGVGDVRYRVIRRVWRPVLMSISESGE